MAHKVRATIEPSVVREVGDAELVDLARQGLLHSYEHTDAAGAVLDDHALAPKVKAWKSPEKGDDVVTPPPGMTDPAANAGEGAKKKGE